MNQAGREAGSCQYGSHPFPLAFSSREHSLPKEKERNLSIDQGRRGKMQKMELLKETRHRKLRCWRRR